MDETTKQVTSLDASGLILAGGSQPSLVERRLHLQRPVGEPKVGTWNLAAQDGELMAKHQDLQVLGGVAAGQQHKQLDGAAHRRPA